MNIRLRCSGLLIFWIISIMYSLYLNEKLNSSCGLSQ
nr:MAG TPA: hypothetical protein [Caudoviricetes sp.]